MEKTLLTPPLNKQALAKNFSLVARQYNEVAILQKEVGSRLLERLDLIKKEPGTILDLGAGTGSFSEPLAVKYPKANIINLDFAIDMLSWLKNNRQHSPSGISPPVLLCADAEQIPLESDSIDLVFSNCSILWMNHRKTFQEIYRILKPNGLFLFSTLGPDTLKEIRHFLQRSTHFLPTNAFMDMHDVGDFLLQSHFFDPVMDRENLILNYQDVDILISDLKSFGEDMDSHLQKSFLETETKKFSLDSLGAFSITYECIYGIAWKMA